MFEIEEAQARIGGTVVALPPESVLLRDAAERVAAEDISASIALPPFDNSAMDGYALRAADVTSATADSPSRLKCIGSVPAGTTFADVIQRGHCVRIFTGSPLPRGADAVVMQEDTRVADEFVDVLDPVKSWENVRLAGEDIKPGAIVVQRGERLTAARLALAGAVGIERVSVGKRPLVGILGTGNELIEPGNPLVPGQIYESNRAALGALVAQSGGVPRVFPLARDAADEIRRALEKAFAECDAVVTTGGVSVGEHDCVKAAFESLGGTLEFWRVNVRPGKPFVFGKLHHKLLFGLPGNPVSAFVTFLLLVRPAILKMQGASELALARHAAVLAESVHNRSERRHFMRVVVDGKGHAKSAGGQASHMLSSLATANALLDVPPKTLWAGGQPVDVLRWEF